MKAFAHPIGAIALALLAGCLVVLASEVFLGRAAALPFDRETLRAWGGHSGLFGLLLMLSALIPTAIAAFALCSISFAVSGRSSLPVIVAACVPWLWMFVDAGSPAPRISNAFIAAQVVIGCACVPAAAFLAAWLQRRVEVTRLQLLHKALP